MHDDWKAFLATAAISVGVSEGVKALARLRVLSSVTARKTMHISMGPVYVLCWGLFSDDPAARYKAAVVPLLITAKFAAAGLGLVNDPDTVRSMSRTGDRRELLRGPLLYGLVFVGATLLCWRQLAGVLAVVALCFGDGAADLVGRRFGHVKLPWSPRKSWAGSLGFFAASLGGGAAFAHVMRAWGWIGAGEAGLAQIASASAVAALVESLPVEEWDNLTVFGAVLWWLR